MADKKEEKTTYEMNETSGITFQEAADEIMTSVALLPSPTSLIMRGLMMEFLHWMFAKNEAHPRLSEVILQERAKKEAGMGIDPTIKKTTKYDA